MTFDFKFRRDNPPGIEGRLEEADYDANLDKIEERALYDGKPLTIGVEREFRIQDTGDSVVQLLASNGARQVMDAQAARTFIPVLAPGEYLTLYLKGYADGPFLHSWENVNEWVKNEDEEVGVPPRPPVSEDEQLIVTFKNVDGSLIGQVVGYAGLSVPGLFLDPVLLQVSGEADAVQFLDTASFGATVGSIGELLTNGNVLDYVTEQVASWDDGSEHAHWEMATAANGQEFRVPKPGWFANLYDEFNWPNPAAIGDSPEAVATRNRAYYDARYITGGEAEASFSDPSVNSPGPLALAPGFGNQPMAADRNAKGTYMHIDTAMLMNRHDSMSIGHARSLNGLRHPKGDLLCRTVHAYTKMFPLSEAGGAFPGNFRSMGEVAQGWLEFLGRHAFGNFTDFIEELVYQYPMANMLTHYRNSGSPGNPPDENAAREWPQLFTVGVSQLTDGGELVLNAQDEAIDAYDPVQLPFLLAPIFTGLFTPFVRDQSLYYSAPIPVNEDGSLFSTSRADRADGNINARLSLATNGIRWTFNDGNRYRSLYLDDERYENVFHRQRPSEIRAGQYYKVNQVSGDLSSLGAGFNPQVGDVFLASSDGQPGMNTGFVEKIVYGYAGIAPYLRHVTSASMTGTSVTYEPLGINIPAGLDPVTRVRRLAEQLVRAPNTARYVALRFIRFFTTSNPSPQYVNRVVNVFRANVNSPRQMGEVIKQILCDPEARSAAARALPNRFGYVHDPYEVVGSFVRKMGVTRFGPRLGLDTALLHLDQVSPTRDINSQSTDRYTPFIKSGVAHNAGVVGDEIDKMPISYAENGNRLVGGWLELNVINDDFRVPLFGFRGPIDSPSIFGPNPEFTAGLAAQADMRLPELSFYNASTTTYLQETLIGFLLGGRREFTNNPAWNRPGGDSRPTGPEVWRNWNGWNGDTAPAGPRYHPEPRFQRNGGLGVISFDHLGPFTTWSNQQVVDEMSMLLTADRVPQSTKDAIVALLDTATAPTNQIQHEQRLIVAISCVVRTPEFLYN
jgi:hypothetical protein